MSRRITHALRASARPSIIALIGLALAVVTHWSKVADDPRASIFACVGLVLIVFLTFFVLALTGFEESPQGVVDVPRVYAWSLLFVIVVLVFGVLFYFLR